MVSTASAELHSTPVGLRAVAASVPDVSSPASSAAATTLAPTASDPLSPLLQSVHSANAPLSLNSDLSSLKQFYRFCFTPRANDRPCGGDLCLCLRGDCGVCGVGFEGPFRLDMSGMKLFLTGGGAAFCCRLLFASSARLSLYLATSSTEGSILTLFMGLLEDAVSAAKTNKAL